MGDKIPASSVDDGLIRGLVHVQDTPVGIGPWKIDLEMLCVDYLVMFIISFVLIRARRA